MSPGLRRCLCWALALWLAACDSSANTRHGSVGPQAAGSAQTAGANRLAAVARDESLEVWTADPSVRVQPTTAVGSGRRVIVEGPRIKRYEELAHSHRIDVGQTFVRGPARADDCAEPTDWAEYDEAIQPYMDGSYFADRVPSTRIQIPLTPGADSTGRSTSGR